MGRRVTCGFQALPQLGSYQGGSNRGERRSCWVLPKKACMPRLKFEPATSAGLRVNLSKRVSVLAVHSSRRVSVTNEGPNVYVKCSCEASKLVCGCGVFAADEMWRPEFEFPREQLAQYRRLVSAPGPQDQRRVMEDRTATMGQYLCAKGRDDAKLGPDVMPLWFEGIELSIAEEPPVVVFPDYPSALEDRFRAAAEWSRVAKMGQIHWYDAGSYPSDLRVCPSRLIVMRDKVRVAHDWSNALCPLNSVLDNRPVQFF